MLIDDIVDERTLDHEPGGEILEPPDLFGSYDRCGFDVRGDVFKIVLALAPVPDPVFGEGPGVDFVEEGVEVWHRIVLETLVKKLPTSFTILIL